MKAARLSTRLGEPASSIDVYGHDDIRALLFAGTGVVPQVAMVALGDSDSLLFCAMEGVLSDHPANYYATLLAIEAGRRPVPIHGTAYVVGVDSAGMLTDCPEWIYEWAKEVERQITPPENNDATCN